MNLLFFFVFLCRKSPAETQPPKKKGVVFFLRVLPNMEASEQTEASRTMLWTMISPSLAVAILPGILLDNTTLKFSLPWQQ